MRADERAQLVHLGEDGLERVPVVLVWPGIEAGGDGSATMSRGGQGEDGGRVRFGVGGTVRGGLGQQLRRPVPHCKRGAVGLGQLGVKAGPHLVRSPLLEEVGARIQIPLESGEAGVSFHYRNVDPNRLIGSGQLNIPKTPETRAGVDLTWDWNVGVWLEATYFLYKTSEYLPETLIFATIGGDYTFDLGNGLYTLIEIMGIGLEDIDRIYTNETYWLMAFSQQYPINLVDECRFFALYQPENEVTSLQVDWKRTYDNLILNAVLYYTHAPQSNSEGAVNAFAPSTASIDKGIKLVIQYNH